MPGLAVGRKRGWGALGRGNYNDKPTDKVGIYMKKVEEDKVKITVEEALKVLAAGGMVIVTDREDRENEGDLVGAAQYGTPEMVNFMARHGRGLICCALEKKLCERAGLRLLDSSGGPGAIHGTRFCTPIDAIEGCTTGISAHDRSKTLQRLCADDCSPGDFARPGHLFPIMEANGGLSARQGHTEASVFLAREAGLKAAAVICEMIDDDGQMVRGDRIYELAALWGLGVLRVDEIVAYFKRFSSQKPRRTPVGEKLSGLSLSTAAGYFQMEFLNPEAEARDEDFCLFKESQGGGEEDPRGPLVRIHSECLTGDLLKSLRCDCGPQFQESLYLIEKEKTGYLIYLRQEGRGIGLRAKIRSYHLQDGGLDTLDANLRLGYPADNRDYSCAAAYLKAKGVKKIRLLTNNPDKIRQLEAAGLEVTRVPLLVGRGEENHFYIKTKQNRMGHLSA